MDRSIAGKANLLADKGSVYDLIAMFILLLGGDKQFANQLYGLFTEYLDKGYTYQDIKSEILTSFYIKNNFRWERFSYPKKDENNKNLLNNGTRYFHKELKLLNNLPVVERNIDQGTIVSRESEYYLEPVASYTLQDIIQYFFKTMPFDSQAHTIPQITGMLKYKINQYGIDKLLFMIDLYAQDCKENESVFVLGKWDDYSSIADDRLMNIKKQFTDDESYYTIKQRRLFDV